MYPVRGSTSFSGTVSAFLSPVAFANAFRSSSQSPGTTARQTPCLSPLANSVLNTCPGGSPTFRATVSAASYSPADGQADPALTTRAFANAAQRHGATYWTGTEIAALLTTDSHVTGVRTSRGEVQAEAVVLAAGAWSDTLAEGSKLYRQHCLHCHGLEGNGRGPTGYWVNPPPRDYRASTG